MDDDVFDEDATEMEVICQEWKKISDARLKVMIYVSKPFKQFLKKFAWTVGYIYMCHVQFNLRCMIHRRVK